MGRGMARTRRVQEREQASGANPLLLLLLLRGKERKNSDDDLPSFLLVRSLVRRRCAAAPRWPPTTLLAGARDGSKILSLLPYPSPVRVYPTSGSAPLVWSLWLIERQQRRRSRLQTKAHPPTRDPPKCWPTSSAKRRCCGNYTSSSTSSSTACRYARGRDVTCALACAADRPAARAGRGAGATQTGRRVPAGQQPPCHCDCHLCLDTAARDMIRRDATRLLVHYLSIYPRFARVYKLASSPASTSDRKSVV